MMVYLELIDAFTQSPGSGNRAGLVSDAAALSDATMQSIARAVGAAETAFLLPSPAGADIALRYFTPAQEVPFCGHATVASFHRMAETGRLVVPGTYQLHCKAGLVPVE